MSWFCLTSSALLLARLIRMKQVRAHCKAPRTSFRMQVELMLSWKLGQYVQDLQKSALSWTVRSVNLWYLASQSAPEQLHTFRSNTCDCSTHHHHIAGIHLDLQALTIEAIFCESACTVLMSLGIQWLHTSFCTASSLCKPWRNFIVCDNAHSGMPNKRLPYTRCNSMSPL